MDNTAVWIALITAIAAVITTPVLEAVRYRHRRQEREDDYKRLQEEKRERAAVAEKVDKQTALMEAQRRFQVEAAVDAQDRLKEITTLVNGKTTKVLLAQLNALKGQLSLMREVIELRLGHGQQPTPETMADLAALKEKIRELETTIVDHSEQAEKATAERGSSEK